MIVIVGCDHSHQRKRQSCWGEGVEAFEREQKRHFVDRLEYASFVREYGVAAIGEEIEQGADTFARDIACGLVYANIDMHDEQRRAAGIPREYSTARERQRPEDIERWDAIRERHMVEQTSAMPGAGTKLVVCGRLHQHRLGELFRNAGEDVTVVDLSAESWYSERWAEDYERNPDPWDELGRQFRAEAREREAAQKSR